MQYLSNLFSKINVFILVLLNVQEYICFCEAHMTTENFEVSIPCRECGSAFITDCPLDILCDHCVDVHMEDAKGHPLERANVLNHMAKMIEAGRWLGWHDVTFNDCIKAAEHMYLKQMAVLL